MNRVMGRKLAMANRVREFCRANPAGTPGYPEAIEQLEQQLALVNAVTEDDASRSVTLSQKKTALRETIRDRYLRHLARIAQGSSVIENAFPREFRVPRLRVKEARFYAIACRLIAAASTQQALFIQDGMPASFVPHATALLEEYRQLMEGPTPVQDPVPPGEVVAQAMRSITLVLRRLDGIYMLWFESRPEMQEVWREVRLQETIESAAPGHAAVVGDSGDQRGLEPAA